MTEASSDRRRRVPRTDAVLDDPRLSAAIDSLGRELVKREVREAQQRVRDGHLEPADVAGAVLDVLPTYASGLRRVVNATGVVVHTNLGRAPLSLAARDALVAASGCTDVEFDLASGRRGRRGRGAQEALAAAVPSAGDAHLVNNNAAALLLCALALSPAGKQIVISRGELVQIGDGFRIPELLASAGSRLREVGTTNRTSAADYAEAIGPDTGFVLKVHPSNFHIEGFASCPSVAELAALPELAGVPLVADIGSGLLRRHPRLPDEPDAESTLAAGADLVTASGDKLLGGPQAGLLLGDAELVRRLRRHPSARAMRVDKLTLAAFEATLRGPAPPVAEALDVDADALRERAERMAKLLRGDGIAAEVVDCESAVGGGGAPGVRLGSVAVELPAAYAERLRTVGTDGALPVIGRVERDRCLLDLRTVGRDEDARVLAAVRAARAGGDGGEVRR